MAAVYHFTGVFLRDARPGIKGALTVLGPQLLGYELDLPEALDASLAACDVDKTRRSTGARKARACLYRKSTRERAPLPLSLPYDHVHMPALGHLTIIPLFPPRAGP